MSRASTASPARVGAGLHAGLLAAGLAAPALSRRLARRMPRAAADNAVVATAVVCGYSSIALLEARRPFRAEWNRDLGDHRTDVAHFVTNVSLSTTLGGAVGAGLAGALRRGRRGGPLAGLERLPLPVRTAAALALFELVHYAHHRVAHEHPLPWRLHAVHHSARRLYWLNALRFHVGDLFLETLYESFLLGLSGLDPETRLARQVVRAVYGQIQHCNIDIDSGWFNAVFATPEQHRWHHSDDPAEGNANYGAVINLWDRLLGTYRLPPRPFDAALGLAGVSSYPEDWVGQTLAPLRG